MGMGMWEWDIVKIIPYPRIHVSTYPRIHVSPYYETKNGKCPQKPA